MKLLLDLLLRLYQGMISPWLGHHCRFSPSCSHYMRDAIRHHGVLRGLGLGSRRLLRCHPFSNQTVSHNVDPVPLP